MLMHKLAKRCDATAKAKVHSCCASKSCTASVSAPMLAGVNSLSCDTKNPHCSKRVPLDSHENAPWAAASGVEPTAKATCKASADSGP